MKTILILFTLLISFSTIANKISYDSAKEEINVLFQKYPKCNKIDIFNAIVEAKNGGKLKKIKDIEVKLKYKKCAIN